MSGDGHELFIVEGESAADAIQQVCSVEHQHIHPIQGKPMNVFRASEKTIWANERVNGLYRRVVGSPSAYLSPDYISFDRVILLTDADADGVHAKALLLGIFAEVMPEIISEGRLFTIRAPQFAISYSQPGGPVKNPVFAYSTEGRESVISQLVSRGATRVATQHFAGLAGMSPHELTFAFTNPETRQISALEAHHVEAARSVLA